MTMVVRFWYLQIIERFWKVQADNPCSAMSKVWDGDILIMLWLLISCIYDNHESSTLRARWWWWCRRGFRLIWPLLRVRMDNFDHSFLQNTIFVFTRTNRTIGLFLNKTSNTTKWIKFSNQTSLSLLPSVLNDGDDDDGQSNVLIIMATTVLTLLKLLSLGRWINVLMIDVWAMACLIKISYLWYKVANFIGMSNDKTAKVNKRWTFYLFWWISPNARC